MRVRRGLAADAGSHEDRGAFPAQSSVLDEDALLVLPFAVQVACNADTVFIHTSWEGNQGDAHRYLRYIDGTWRREGGPRREGQSTLDNDAARGPTDVNSTIYESRVTFLLDDPAGGLFQLERTGRGRDEYRLIDLP